MNKKIFNLISWPVVMSLFCVAVCSCGDNDGPDSPSADKDDPLASKLPHLVYTISGGVRNSEDAPVENATILILDPKKVDEELRPDTIASLKTDKEGKYSFTANDYETGADWYFESPKRDFRIECIPPDSSLKSVSIDITMTYKVSSIKPEDLIQGKGSYSLFFVLSPK